MHQAHWIWTSLGVIAATGALAMACTDSGGSFTLIYDGFGPHSTGAGWLDPECLGEPNEINVKEQCGIFVQADALGSAEDGTQAHPYKTLQKAIDNAGSKHVYACASAPYREAVTIEAPREVYGGFDCTRGWTWNVNARTTLNGPAGTVALTLMRQAGGTKVQGFAITSDNATAKGDSSIAVAVADISASLVNCEATAGDGMVGEDGAWFSSPSKQGKDAPLADAAMNACINPASVSGGLPGKALCDDGLTAGGAGGKGGITAVMNGNGMSGSDGMPADASYGRGGAGETATHQCEDGAPGKDGVNGAAGDAGVSPGELWLTGVKDNDMTDGKPGTKGQGGGGGGAAKSGMICAGITDGNGASGGGGGAGSCGGKGGQGGKAGGSSIAVLSLGTKLLLTEVSLQTGKGGDGGKGRYGQVGSYGAVGADSGEGTFLSTHGCQGGAGGAGGAGGPGGGGRGGHSVGIAYASTPSKAPALKGFIGAMMGQGGAPGSNNMMGKGAAGAAGACWDFDQNTACSL